MISLSVTLLRLLLNSIWEKEYQSELLANATAVNKRFLMFPASSIFCVWKSIKVWSLKCFPLLLILKELKQETFGVLRFKGFIRVSLPFFPTELIFKVLIMSYRLIFTVMSHILNFIFWLIACVLDRNVQQSPWRNVLGVTFWINWAKFR